MVEHQDWVKKAKGNKAGNRFIMFMLSTFGLLPAYFMLLFASMQYTILDSKSKGILRDFRNRAGLKSRWYHLYRHFFAFGMSLIDRYAFLMTQKQFFTFTTKNEDVISKETEKGNGVILLGAHFGNWELAGNLLQNRIKTKVNFLMLNAESDDVKNILSKATDNRNVNIIYISPGGTDASIEIVNALRRGEVVCLHGDRIVKEQRYEEVSFLGKNAKFPVGPFILAMTTGAPVLPIYAVKTGLKSYAFTALDPIRLENIPRDQRSSALKNAVTEYARGLEKMVKEYPGQWFNYYDFWG
jgi:predicted LPLAT superfamily acyltransferase